MATSDDEPGDGRRARWEQHNVERRRLILEAAVSVIEEQPPGAEFHVHQIAARAEVPRAAVYRHFADRADLDRALREFVLADLKDRLFAQFTLEGSINQIIHRIINEYVDWAVAHPSLHRLADTATFDGEQPGPLHQTLQQIAEQVHELVDLATAVLGVQLNLNDTDALDLFIFGLVAEMIGVVRHWLWREVRAPAADTLAELMTGLAWTQFDALARERGLVIDPTVPIDQLVAGALQQPE